MTKIGPTFAAELAAAGVPLASLSWDRDSGKIVATDGDDHRAAAEAVLAKHDPSAKSPPYLTGGDVIDGMSPAQATAQGVDPRDIVRIQNAPMASMVKSKIARVAKANGVSPDALLAQATPTGGL